MRVTWTTCSVHSPYYRLRGLGLGLQNWEWDHIELGMRPYRTGNGTIVQCTGNGIVDLTWGAAGYCTAMCTGSTVCPTPAAKHGCLHESMGIGERMYYLYIAPVQWCTCTMYREHSSWDQLSYSNINITATTFQGVSQGWMYYTQLHAHSCMHTAACTQLHAHSCMHTATCTQMKGHQTLHWHLISSSFASVPEEPFPVAGNA